MSQVNRIIPTAALLVGLALLALPLAAADNSPGKVESSFKVEEGEPVRAEPLGDLVIVQGDRDLLSPKLQTILEGRDPGRTRLPDGSTLAEASRDPGVVEYSCSNNGTCTCFGAYDCVQMIAADGVCEEGTVGCNGELCVCNESGTQCPFEECTGGG